ncbi:nucleotidyltransferase domain-containing protein [Candidatus Sumerlaeota bacterium]|nr:nucleotidyltransferase domain-containing protein [Candidatus Sumerlaeota bacterium]
MKTIDTDLLSEVVRRLVAEFAPEQVILFGSHAWGEPSDDSDVDLLVIVSESCERLTQRATRAYRCLRGLPLPTEILVKTRAEMERFQDVYASLECQILERGKVLYDREQTWTGAGLADKGIA